MQFLNYYSKFLLYFPPTNSTKVKFENIHIKYLKSCNFCGFPVHGEYDKSPPYSNVFGMFLVELTSQSILLWHSKSHKHTTSGGGLGWVRVDGWEGTRPPHWNQQIDQQFDCEPAITTLSQANHHPLGWGFFLISLVGIHSIKNTL